MKIFKAIKNFFRSKYYVLYELITLRLMLRVNNMVRKLIISKGKDPDYVATPPPPPPEPPFGRKAEHARGYTGCCVTSGYSMANGASWVKNPTEHPIIKSRQKYEAKQFKSLKVVEEPLQVVSTAASTTITEIGADAISSIRSALRDLEAFTEPAELKLVVSESVSADENKVARAREVCQEMISKGLLQDTPQSIEDQAIEIVKWSDEAFAAFSRVLAMHNIKG